ncbi:MmcB family DNA repair protein [Paracoccus shanxieyensis]|uniref:MmcB family DNA repair protein n=1 Tax=Paracoccus shanxieyensis TaxID=2675752 RepID=A0A6L6IVI8_9RHOB|nr:MmcB family DNA repair protein [Paracoccus shanxieyensis]MTH63598.1 MmcB family DNA repair protein [Paracoccus shanxieyensis]MTH86519.1 MmcB family DNA repair protein [Paracoccus shanxieyensis]
MDNPAAVQPILTEKPSSEKPSSEKPGQRLARGVARMLAGLGHAPLAEFVPSGGLRVDVISVSPKGEIWVVECKSCRADFIADRKWQGYLDYCDRFFWAVDCDFPEDLLPEGSGLIRADDWGAELLRMPPETRLAAARRNRLLRDIARVSTARLLSLTDPMGISGAASW